MSGQSIAWGFLFSVCCILRILPNCLPVRCTQIGIFKEKVLIYMTMQRIYNGTILTIECLPSEFIVEGRYIVLNVVILTSSNIIIQNKRHVIFIVEIYYIFMT